MDFSTKKIIISLYFLVEAGELNVKKTAQISMFDLMGQIDKSHKLVALANQLDWCYLEGNLSQYYCLDNGAPAKPIRLMSRLLMLKVSTQS